MKRYISAVLIPCLLLQLFGCYSQKDITVQELTSETDDEVVITLNNSDEYFLKSNVTPEELIDNPDIKYCISADTSVEDLILYRKVVTKIAGNSVFTLIDTIQIKKDDIRSIQTTEKNTANSIALTVVIVVSLGALGATIHSIGNLWQ